MAKMGQIHVAGEELLSEMDCAVLPPNSAVPLNILTSFSSLFCFIATFNVV